MLKYLLVKENGAEIGSTIILSCTLTASVNSEKEFTLGSACTDEIEVEYIAADEKLIAQGDKLTLYTVDDANTRTKAGVFYCEKPEYQGMMREVSGSNAVYKVVAYDTMSKLDADFSGWLRANQAQFPKTIWQLVQLACQRAGVTLASSSLPINGSYSVQAFYADDLTCRQIISWAAEAAGCYAHMNADGKLQFLTYTDKRSTAKITPDGASNSTAYYADSLSYEDYTVKAIEKVQIRQSDSDVGVIYPDSTTATNTYAVQGNLIFDCTEHLFAVNDNAGIAALHLGQHLPHQSQHFPVAFGVCFQHGCFHQALWGHDFGVCLCVGVFACQNRCWGCQNTAAGKVGQFRYIGDKVKCNSIP